MGYLTPTEQAIAEQVSERLKDLEALLQRRHELAVAAVQESVEAIQAFREQYGNLV